MGLGVGSRGSTGRKVEFPDMPFISEIANFLIQGGIG